MSANRIRNNQFSLYGIRFKEILTVYVIATAAIIVSAYMIYNQMEDMSRIYSCGLDGIIVWCTSSMLNLGLLPIIISVFLHMHYDIYMRNICVVKQKNRVSMWLGEQKLALIICAGVFTWSMILSGVMAYVMNHGNMFINISEDSYLTNTYYGIMLSQYEHMKQGVQVSGSPFTSIPHMLLTFLRVWIINMLQLYMVVMAADIIYWLSGKRLLSTVILSVFCMVAAIFPKTRRYAYYIGIKVKAASFYLEAMDIKIWLKHIFIMLLIILIAHVIIMCLTRRKDMI